MCGIVGLQLRDAGLTGRLGEFTAGMLGHLRERGPDSAGIGIYGDPRLRRDGWATVSIEATEAEEEVSRRLGPDVEVVGMLDMRVIQAPGAVASLAARIRAVFPRAAVMSTGTELTVLKGVGDPSWLAESFDLASRNGYQAIGHTRLATESAVTTAHGHPFCVRPDLGFVHNGSFANHCTVRRRLEAEGIVFDTDNDTEVGARFVGWRLDQGDDLEKAMRQLCETFDGFYTLLVTTADLFAVVRDVVGCKPALVAQTSEWVAMASEYRALSGLPGIDGARVFEPEPEEVYLWSR